MKVLIFDKTQGLNNVDKPVELPYDKDVGLTYLSKSVNVNVDNKGKIQRRKGASRVLSGNFHSLFAILDYFICVEKVASPPNATGNALTILDTLYNKTVLGYLTGSGRMSYQKVGNRVYFANGTNRGIIENRIYSQWNKQDHVGPVTDKVFSNPPKGHLICLHHGRMFMAENNFLWESRPFSYAEFDVARDFTMFASRIRMVKSVSDGLWVSDNDQIYFLRGSSSKDFIREVKTSYPAVEGTDILIQGEYVGDEGIGEGLICFTSEKGICLAGSNGMFKNTNIKTVKFNPPLSGASYFKDGRYISSLIY